MASQSLYRKWRSQTFSDLVGQEAIVRTLCHAVRDGRLAHAYLFCGPRGTGKTSVARLLAKAVNCAKPHDGEPCNVCVSCREITEGRSPDVFEIDAASNNGVDNIRELRENANILSSGGRYRIYIVDECHMLSPQAFNALLKTLEEPPPHVLFVLATTEAHKVLATIVSRCQRFDFRRHSRRNIVAHLLHVAEGEQLHLERPAADLLARAAQGGMRDALSLLDQAMAFCGTEITLDGVRDMLGLAGPGAVRELVEHVAAEQSAAGLHLINELVIAGVDLRQLNSQLAELWRALFLARAGADVAQVMDCGPEEAAEFATLAAQFTLDELTACARVFAANDTPARGLPVPQLGLELSFLDCLSIRRRGGAAPPAVSSQPARAATAPAPTTPPATVPARPAAPLAATPPQAPPPAATNSAN
ncbi:MAG TPA: DNA polymerase III subunit gamma/tau, partial [Ktedonobacterales bacterium]|nr:DNA polymerase III subunit gamma/tau [Ktedonobacterales bacterium]